MEFGRLSESELQYRKLYLPKEPIFNSSVLKGRPSNTKAWLGTSKWGRKEWIGKLYPKGTKGSAFLTEYVQHFNAIHFAASHYQIYTPADIENWADKVAGYQFIFSPKLTNVITHYSGFTEMETETQSFIDGVKAFGEHLGPVHLQVSEKFRYKRAPDLYAYLESWPADLPLFLEVRHPEWFEDLQIWTELIALLRRLNKGLVITDTPGRRDVVHMHLTTPRAYIRFSGTNQNNIDYPRIDEWARRISIWMSRGLEELYFFISMTEEANTPDLCAYAVDRLNEICGLNLPPVKFIS